MLLSVTVVLGLLSCVCGENPAVQVVLTNKGLQYGKHEAAGWIQERLSKITFPDITGSVHIIFGNVDYTLTGITIVKCDLPEPSVEFLQNPPGFQTTISDLSIAITGDWRTHFGLIHDGGTFDMAIYNVDVTSVAQLGKEADGHPSVSSLSCHSQVGDVDIEFHGGASFIFQPFVKHFKGRIRDEIQKRLCPGVEGNIQSFEDHLHVMNVSVDVNEVLTLALPLTDVPIIGASGMNVGLKGEFYNIKTPVEPPFEAQPFTMPDEPSYMLSVGMSDFTLNSASYAYFSAKLLQLLITDSMIPPISPVHLNTTSLGKFIPKLAEMYPDMLMSVLVYAQEAPKFSIQPDAINVSIKAVAKASVILPNGTQIPVFTINVDSKFSSELWIDDGKLKGSVKMDNVTLTLASSEVGTFKTDSLESLARTGGKFVLVKVNQKLREGFLVLRTKYAQLVNSVLKKEKGFLSISSDVQVVLT
ncbi:lipopolysaccharide-binding protein [Oreochromis niloticus]|uniref:Bactericidal permeability-increasing protein n=1 Tax=Oreochromis niloticus TaxID=8128 RepID=A0A669BR63_ORENI|nr:lipopolysaccharide-binding protein [Oreochromis niloticus]XP_013126600.1 lipopolysaccharide-binding protein [Oreochromis niloticus]XP_013126601.1 lipopolysaccharide-binding protein [Oreochromis niloticus]